MKALARALEYREAFRPWVIQRGPGFVGWLSYLGRLVIDTPHRSLISGITPLLRRFQGRVLDVGAGAQFYRRLLSPTVRYVGLELASKDVRYDWEGSAIDVYDGTRMPYGDGQFDHVLCLEVLEHAEEPERLLQEIARVLKPNGTAVLSVPFAAKWHYVPYDYWRFTPSGLERLVARAGGLDLQTIYRRGGETAVVFHFAMVALIGLLFRRSVVSKVIGLLCLPLAMGCGLLANLSEWLDFGAPEQTLGYVCLLQKPDGIPALQEPADLSVG